MPTFTFRFPIEPVSGLEGLAYLQRGLEPPAVAHSYRPASLGAAMCVPTHMRWFHKLYATMHGYFWMPCPRCLRYFGGHEVGESIAWPEDGPDRGRCVCTDCTIELAAKSQDSGA